MTAETCPQFAIATTRLLLQPTPELQGENTTAPEEASEQHKQTPRPAGIGQHQGLKSASTETSCSALSHSHFWH